MKLFWVMCWEIEVYLVIGKNCFVGRGFGFEGERGELVVVVVVELGCLCFVFFLFSGGFLLCFLWFCCVVVECVFC